MAKSKQPKLIPVFDRVISREEIRYYELIGKVTTGASERSHLFFGSPEEVSEVVYKSLEDAAKDFAKFHFMAREKMGIVGAYGVAPEVIYDFRIDSAHSRLSRVQVGNVIKYVPSFEVDASGLAYRRRNTVRKQIKEKTIKQLIAELGLEDLENPGDEVDLTLHGVNITERLDSLDSSLLSVAGEEADESHFSTEDIRGESPHARYISFHDEPKGRHQ